MRLRICRAGQYGNGAVTSFFLYAFLMFSQNYAVLTPYIGRINDMITLKEHNIKPYEELCRMLEEQDKLPMSLRPNWEELCDWQVYRGSQLIDDTVILCRTYQSSAVGRNCCRR